MNLIDYVLANSVRGACQCGACLDAPPDPETHQPPDDPAHTVNLTFFKVARIEGADAGTFRKLVEAEHPGWLDGNEHSYIEMGSDMGDQGIALQTIGLGHVLGVWKALSPDTMLGNTLPPELKMTLAGSGLVSEVTSV